MDPRDKESTTRRPLIVSSHKKRSVGAWLVPLAVIIVVMIFLPRVIALLD